MKKQLLVLVTAIFMATMLNAQDLTLDTRSNIKFGVKAGLNYSNVWDEYGEEFRADGKFGLVGGIWLGIPISEYLGFQPGIQFSQKGFKATGMLLGESYDMIRTTNHIDIPLLITVKPIEYISIGFGPQYSYLIQQKDEFVNTTTSIAQMTEFENDNIRKNILGLTGGFDINLDHLVFSGRIGYDLANNNGDGTSTTPRYKNAWSQITIGYRLF
jgi:hypothetical protein